MNHAPSCPFALGTQPAGGQPPPEIKVIELDAYATVADLIHAAVSANDGAAALKEVRHRPALS